MSDLLQANVRFDFIRYANCWEDADVLCAALQPTPGKRFLSIASGGDNSFALLAEGAEVVAADLSLAQIACVELKAAAIRALDHSTLLAFLGIKPDVSRWAIYRQLRSKISARAAGFWDPHRKMIEHGIIHSGKFEKYFSLFRRHVLPWVHTQKRIHALLDPKNEMERHDFYRQEWNNVRWKMLFRIFFSRFVMGRLGRDPEFFRYVKGNVADQIMKRTRYALTVLPTDRNPYLEYILTGNFNRTLPRYLDPSRFDALRAGLDQLTLFEGTVQDAGRVHRSDGFDGYNLSDIFEYLAPPMCEQMYTDLLSTARPGARWVYWNMLVPRTCPPTCRNSIVPLTDLSMLLFMKDRAFFYSAFVVEEVKSGGDSAP